MRPAAIAYAVTQGGLITRKQARLAGYTDTELRSLTSPKGRWVVVRRGVYCEREHWEGRDETGQRLLHDRAVSMNMIVVHVLSHDSAARAHGVPMLRDPHSLAHVTRGGIWGSRSEHGVKHHLTRFCPPESVSVSDLPVTTMARTGLDLAREHGFAAGVIAMDHGLRRGEPPENYEAELMRMWCWPHIARAQAAYRFADPGAESIAESLGRMFVHSLGIGAVETQFPIRTPAGVFWADLRVGCHVFEIDGYIKYASVENGGVASEPAAAVVWREKKRERLIMAEGLGFSRLIWEDFFGPGRERARERVLREYAITERRHGPYLPERMVRAAAEIRRTHPRVTGTRSG